MYCSIHYFTSKSTENDDTSNTAITFYHEKNNKLTDANLYDKYTEAYLKSAGKNCIIQSKRLSLLSKTTKLKENLKDLSNLISTTAVIKQIWCSPQIILLFLQDFCLIWIYINPITCNLIKILVDKTLISSLKLSGKHVSDVKIVYKTSDSAPIIVIAYSDRFKVDFISCTKVNAFKKYLENTEEKLEKLSAFDASVYTIEMDSQPPIGKIDKFLCTNADVTGKRAATLTIWWKNDGQIIWTPINTVEKPIKVLKDSNIVVFNIEKTTAPFIEYTLRSQSGQLMSLFYINQTILLAIEQIELKSKQYQIDIYRYELNTNPNLSANAQNSLKARICTFQIDAKIEKAEQISHTEKYLLLASSDLTIFLYDLQLNIIRKFRIIDSTMSNICLVEWLLNDLLFFIYDNYGNICLYDVALNKIELNYEKRECTEVKTLSNKKQDGLLTHFTSYRRINFDFANICFYFRSGSFGLLRVSIPMNFNEISLITMHLKCSTSKAITVLSTLNWDENSKACILGFCKIMNSLLNVEVLDNDTQMLIEQTLACFYKPQKPLNESTIKFYKYLVTRYARRYFYKLIRFDFYDKAYLLGVDIGAKDLFNDLYYYALNKKHLQLAEICRKKYKEIELEECDETNTEDVFSIRKAKSHTEIDDVTSTDGYNSDNLNSDVNGGSDDDDGDNDDEDDEDYDVNDFDEFSYSENEKFNKNLNDYKAKLNFDKINFNSIFKKVDNDFQKLGSIFSTNDKIISSSNFQFE